MRWLRDILTLGFKELKVLVRDRQAAALLFVMPAVFVFLLSLAVGDLYSEKANARIKVALVLEDDGPHAALFAEVLDGRSEIEVVDVDQGVTGETVFQENIARALVRVPLGFSDRIDEMIESDSLAEGLVAQRIEWAVSPRADAINQAIIRISLTLSCVRVVQDRIKTGARELTSGMGSMASDVEHLVEMLENAVWQLESTKAQLTGTDEDRIAFARAAEAEGAMAEEAARARAELEGEDGDGGALVSRATDGGGAAVEAEVIGIDTTEIEVISAEKRAELDRLLEESKAPSDSLLSSTDVEIGEDELLVRGRNADGEVILPDPVQQNVPGWTLFAMFFIVVPLSSALHRERLEGTTRRLLALGTPRGTILMGKLWPFVALGLLQFGAMVLVGMFLVPIAAKGVRLELGPNPITLIPLTIVCAFAATSYSLLVATLCRTSEQAAAFGASSVVILAAIGGIMIPHFMMPPVLQNLAQISPLYWGHQAYLDVFLLGASVQDIAKPIGILTGIGFVCLLLSGRRAVT